MPTKVKGLMLGFGCVTRASIRSGVVLREMLQDHARPGRLVGADW